MITGLDHFGLVIDNLAEQVKFYEKLGFKVAGKFLSEAMGAEAVMLRKDGDGIELWKFENTTVELVRMIEKHVALSTDNLEADIAEFTANGYNLVIPIDEGKVVKRYAYVKNPSGNYIELCEPLAE